MTVSSQRLRRAFAFAITQRSQPREPGDAHDRIFLLGQLTPQRQNFRQLPIALVHAAAGSLDILTALQHGLDHQPGERGVSLVVELARNLRGFHAAMNVVDLSRQRLGEIVAGSREVGRITQLVQQQLPALGRR